MTLKGAEGRLAEASEADRTERLIDLAEIRPVFRYRQNEVRPLLEEASQRLSEAARPDLEMRCLLRLGNVELDSRPQAAREIAIELSNRVAKGSAVSAAALALQSRAVRRLGGAAEADELLGRAAAVEIAGDQSGVSALSVFVALTLAGADKLLDEQSSAVIPLLRHLLNTLDEARAEEFDARFQALLQLGLALRWDNRPDAQLRQLRALVTLVKEHDSGLDLLEVRLALGTALAAAHEPEEARRVLQYVVDQARDLDEEKIRVLGLVGLSGALSESGAVQGAVARAVESAVASSKLGDVFGYVRGATIAAQVLVRHGREVPAVELLMYANAALREACGPDMAALIQAQLDGMREEWGEEHYEQVCRKLLEVRAARARTDNT